MSEDKKQTPEGQPVNPNVELVNIDEELKTSYLAYSMSVIVGRALPDVRDGLKPVHRRILYAMDKIGCDRTTRKSARIVGDVIGKYHPHGDTAAYDALVRLAQPFNMRYTLVEGQGNFGSIDGDGAAAQRYTEAKLDRISEYVLCDLDKDTVDFVPNFDGAEMEPVVLATKIPLLLVNGSNGIAVGMATNIPPHNLNEICDGLVHLMKNPDCTTRDLMQYVKGPDFPTFGTIYGRKGIYDAYNTGQGKIQMRARVEEEVVHGHNALVIKEIPYQVNRSRLIKSIQDLVKEKRIEGIHDIRNESGRSGKRKGSSSGNQGNSLATRIVIELKKDAIPQLVLNQLYKMTQLQTTFGVIMLAVVNNRPMVLSLKEVLSYFIEFRRDVVVRRHIYLLRKAREREHILRGFEIALDHIDEVIAIIRGSDDANQARERLTERFGLSEIQTKAILEMRLQRLTGMERSKVMEELANLIAAIKEYEIILKSKERLDEIIIGEFNEVKALFGDARRTQIVDSEVEIEDEDLIAEEFCMVMRTQQNYIKRQALSEYRAQKRGGRGKVGMGTKEDDYVRDLFVASSHQIIQVYTTLGRVFSLKVYELPQGSRSTKGKPIVNMLPKLETNEDVAAILPLPMGEKTGYILMATEQGIMKKTPIEAFKNCRKNGLKAITFREGDKLMGVRIVQEEDNVLFVTADGMSLHYETKNMRPSGRTSMGVKAMKLKDGDRLIGMDVISDADCMILTVTERGYGKRTSISEHRTQNRGGMGIRGIKTHERNGKVVSALVVQDDDHLILATDGGTIIRTRVSEIRITGRTAAGVKLMNIGPEEHVVAVAAVSEENDDDIELTSVPVDDSVDEDDGMDEEEILDDEMPEDDIIEEEEEPENEE